MSETKSVGPGASHDNEVSADEPMSLAAAARLISQPRAYLKELAESGRLAVHLYPKDGGFRYKVTRNGLIAANLLIPERVTPEVRADLVDLISLVREQTARITHLEEQRFQLGAQLGAAVERIEALEMTVEIEVPVARDTTSEVVIDDVALPGGSAFPVQLFHRTTSLLGERIPGSVRERVRLPGRLPGRWRKPDTD